MPIGARPKTTRFFFEFVTRAPDLQQKGGRQPSKSVAGQPAQITDDLEIDGPLLKIKDGQRALIKGRNFTELGDGGSIGRAAFTAWRSRIEATGVLVFQATGVSSEEASGFAISEDRFPLIVVNQKDTPNRRTFSLLHELAHLMLRISGVSDLEADESRPPEDRAIEVFCNHVAAAALMPKDTLLALVAPHGSQATNWADGEISELAKGFGVSREALLRRLLTFGRTTEAFYRQKREQYLAEFMVQRQKQRDQATEDGVPRNMPQETVNNFGKPLVRMVLGNYYQDRLTLSDISGYLRIKTKHIPKLERLAGLR